MVVAVLALAACSPAPGGTSTSSGPVSASPGSPPPTHALPTAAAPGEVYTDQQLVDLATTVVRSRNLQGLVIDTRTLRETAKAATPPAVTGVTTPEQCVAFRLHEETETAKRRTDTTVSFAEGRMPLTGQPSQTTTIVFAIRSAPHGKIASADFSRTDALAAECARFERSYTYSVAGGAMSSTYEVELLKVQPVGQQSYATAQKAKGLGPKDIGMAGMQVLAGTVSIEMALTLWPVDSETTARAVDSMAGFARDLIDEAVKNPPSAPQPNPAGARSPEEPSQLLTGPAGGAGRELYANPTEARVVSRTSAIEGCTSIQANVPGPGRLSWAAVGSLTMKLDADSSYACRYQAASDGLGRSYVRVGARRGTPSVEGQPPTKRFRPAR